MAMFESTILQDGAGPERDSCKRHNRRMTVLLCSCTVITSRLYRHSAHLNPECVNSECRMIELAMFARADMESSMANKLVC